MKIRYSEFRDHINIDALEAALGFVPLYEDRGNDVGHCLFPENHTHGDSTGKFAIHREMMVYNCWVCGGGSLHSLAMELYNFTDDEATAWLYQFASGDTRSDVEFQDYLLAMLKDVNERVQTMPYFNPRVLERFTDSVDYFRERGISDEIIEKYQLKYTNYMMKSAPIKNGQKADDDYYGPAAIFPHFWHGKLVGWQHRWMDFNEKRTKTPRWLAKYTNTGEFPKSDTLFNYDEALRAKQPVIVLESVPSVLFLASHGYPAVSYFGGDTVKPQQLRLMRRFSQGVILAPDNDVTGNRFVHSTGTYLERFIPVYIAEPVKVGPKADLGDYAQTDDPAGALRHHLENKVIKLGVEL